MTDRCLLPFGETAVSVEEYESQIDVDRAISCAREGGVADPKKRINEFVHSVPDLLGWLEVHGREYPWRKSTDPWEVYIAEILLQRTRGDAVENVYDRVIDQFPGPGALADASKEEIRESVHSLGFANQRTRSLREVGEIFTDEFDGELPDNIDELQLPWRVGTYSARATQLFARGEPLALVDANFARVLGRVLGYEMPQQPHKSDRVYSLLEALTPGNPEMARSFNLAILDLGALVCTPDSPHCSSCPINRSCNYYQSN